MAELTGKKCETHVEKKFISCAFRVVLAIEILFSFVFKGEGL